jgi:hypothetical protein
MKIVVDLKPFTAGDGEPAGVFCFSPFMNICCKNWGASRGGFCSIFNLQLESTSVEESLRCPECLAADRV